MGPFTCQAVQSNTVGLNGFILASYLTSLRVTNRDLRRQQLIAEMLALHYPEERILGREKSRAELARILDNTAELSDQTWFIDTTTEMNWTDAEDTKGVRRLWDPNERKWAGQIILEQKLELLGVVARHLPDRSRARVGYSILMFILSFSLRGEIFQAKLTKAMHELSQLMPGVAEQLTRADIALTWHYFGGLVDDSNVADTFARWLGCLDAPTIRVRVIIAQAAGSGLTCLDVIARAIHEHPTFPWHMLMRLFPEEWANAVDVIQRVGNNPYYGYHGDLQHVRSTRYKSLSWACGRLINAGGNKTFGDYKGFVEDRRHKETIEGIILAYYRGQDTADLMGDPTEEEF